MAAVGFGATVMTILAERSGSTLRWTISADAARERAAAMMDTVLAIQARQSQQDGLDWGWAGIPYHFVEADGRRRGQLGSVHERRSADARRDPSSG